MALLDKLNNLAKNVGDKANDAIETTKLNSRINTEKAEIANLLRQIGEYYYGKFAAGEASDPEISGLLTGIEAHYAAIREAEAQLRSLKDTPAQT